MYHSVIIGGYNTWDEWHLVPSERPTIAPPQLKTRYEEIAAIDGSLDFSEALNGLHYENRTGSIEFWAIDTEFKNERVAVPDYGTWQKLYSDILKKIHGKKLRVALEDEPNYYYEGRFTVTSVKTEKNYVSITMDYNLLPRKFYINNINNMIWWPQIGGTDNVLYFDNFRIYGENQTVTKNLVNLSGYAITPKIIVSNVVEVTDSASTSVTLYPGSYNPNDPYSETRSLSVPNGNSTMTFRNINGGYAYIQLDFSPGGIEF